MNTEEKAKAYDEALERAKIHINIKGIGDTVDLCKQFFPELCESEDERIRQWLVDYFKEVGKSWIHRDITCEQILAWLEKQKEASKAIEAIDRIDKYIDEHLANAHDMKDSNPDKKYYRGWDDALGAMAGILQDVYSGEKQKEQKPLTTEETELNSIAFLEQMGYTCIPPRKEQNLAEWSENDERVRNAILGFLNPEEGGTKYSSNAELVEWRNWLKSLPLNLKKKNEDVTKLCYNEWSEEDEGELQNAIDALEFLGKKGVYKSESGYDAALQAAFWLKSLPERFNLEPKEEWSEEDEELLDSIIRVVCGAGIQQNGLREKQVSFLKSLHPSWKPSEEQMEALECAERWYTHNMGHNPALYQLLCDLKSCNL